MKSQLTLTALTAILSLTPGLIQAAQPTTVYAGTVTGISMSTDGGAHWSTLATIGAVGVASIAIDPTNPNNMYAGVYNAVYKSTDGGTHWTEETNGISSSQSTVIALLIDPSNPSTIYAGTTSFGNGVYKSTDSGVHWTAINNGLFTNGAPGASLDVQAMAMDPLNPGTLYLSGNTGLGNFKTTNGGASWAPLTGAVPFGLAMAVDPVNTETVYMVGYPGGGVTTNGGGAWTPILTNATGLFLSLAIDPSNHGTVYAGNGGCNQTLTTCYNTIYKATNGVFGTTPIGALNNNDEVRALAVDPANPNTVYAGSEDGVHISEDGGATWQLSYSTKDVFVLTMKPNGAQGAFFNEIEAGAKDLFAFLPELHNTTLSCDLLQAYEDEVKFYEAFGWLSSSQGQALIAQAQAQAATVPCQ